MRLPAVILILLLGGVHQGTLAALRFARSLSDDVTAVHVSLDPIETEKIQQKWGQYGEGFRLVVLSSPYRLMIEPLLEYLEHIQSKARKNEITTIVVPHFVPQTWWVRFLHMRTAEMLRKVLLNRDDVVIVEVPYQVH